MKIDEVRERLKLEGNSPWVPLITALMNVYEKTPCPDWINGFTDHCPYCEARREVERIMEEM